MVTKIQVLNFAQTKEKLSNFDFIKGDRSFEIGARQVPMFTFNLDLNIIDRELPKLSIQRFISDIGYWLRQLKNRQSNGYCIIGYNNVVCGVVKRIEK
jgi:hypothetical protein